MEDDVSTASNPIVSLLAKNAPRPVKTSLKNNPVGWNLDHADPVLKDVNGKPSAVFPFRWNVSAAGLDLKYVQAAGKAAGVGELERRITAFFYVEWVNLETKKRQMVYVPLDITIRAPVTDPQTNMREPAKKRKRATRG
jgi:hypothetical protein